MARVYYLVEMEGLKYMQMGGSIFKIERMADGNVQRPSPHMNPAAIAIPYFLALSLFLFSHTNRTIVPTNMSMAKCDPTKHGIAIAVGMGIYWEIFSRARFLIRLKESVLTKGN